MKYIYVDGYSEDLETTVKVIVYASEIESIVKIGCKGIAFIMKSNSKNCLFYKTEEACEQAFEAIVTQVIKKD